MTRELIDLNVLVLEAERLEPLPASAARLAAVVSRNDWEISEISEIARLDEALTGRLLGAANSVASGARAEVTSVDQAILRIGPGATLALAIGPSVRALMADVEILGLSEGQLWRHSVASALAIDLARYYCHAPIQPHAFVATLLHDVGKLVLARHIEPTTEAFLRRAKEQGFDPIQAEEQLLRIDHGQLGALVARSWGLPDTIADGIRFHHRPLASLAEETRRLCHQISLADAVAAAIGEPSGPDSEPAFDGAIAGSLGITLSEFEELVGVVREQLTGVLALYQS